MQHSWRGILVLVMLSGAVLACGMPLPSALLPGGIAAPVCAADEAAETCALRQAAFEALAAAEALAVESFAVDLFMDNARELMQLSSSGRYNYVVSDVPEGFGADIHLWIDSLTLQEEGELKTFTGMEIIMIGMDAYWSEDGGATWSHETLAGDPSTQLGLATFLGLLAPISGEINLLANPDTFVVQVGKADGGIQRHMLTLNVDALVSNAESMTGLLEQTVAADESLGIGLGITDLGEIGEVAAMAPMILSMMNGDLAYSTRIGLDPAAEQVVSYGETFLLDMTLSETDSMQVNWVLDATLGRYDDVPPVVAPAEYSEGSMDDFLGSPLD
ncbi:MAG: hypothetical protein JXN59_19415 [Anaerolineae bacterium]|nr:hypothetical protein [Anaerolineae bacterium]